MSSVPDPLRRMAIRHERNRLIKSGAITPAFAMRPQLMVKVEGQWRPEVKTF